MVCRRRPKQSSIHGIAGHEFCECFRLQSESKKKATLQNGEGKQEQAVAELDNQQEELSNASIEAISRFAFFGLRSK